MTSLNKFLEEHVQDIPRLFLRDAVEKKLVEQGYQDDALVEALTDHIFSDGGETFDWGDGNDSGTKHLNLEFSEQDAENLTGAVDAFLKDELPKVIRKAVKGSAKSIVKNLEKQWPEVRVSERNEMRHFRDRLDLRWAAGLDPLRMLLSASREVGQEFASKLARSRAKNGIVKREAIMVLHMRACQTAMEIITLLENGLPDGAYARWRTLYEISVVAFLIDRIGDEIAEQYLAHDAVSMRQSIVNEFRHRGENYDPTKLRGEEKLIEDEYQAAVEQFGKPFASSYGWAAHNLGLKNPRFQDLENAVDWNALPPDYKWSSFKIHAGVAGTVRTLGAIGDQQIIHAGATNAGLETPAISAAYSLLHVTSLVFSKFNALETQIQMQGLILLRDKVVKECKRAARKLKKDELEFCSGFQD